MLPAHLNGSFKRYKKDTDAFVTWLADAAVGYGLRLHVTAEASVAPNTATRQGPRLKGKARKQAREQTGTSLPETSPTAKKLTMNQLLECAKKIASARSSAFRVPHHVYESLLSALNLRTQCTSWFEKQEQCSDNEDLRQSNASHGYFNTTLEAVRKLLEPFTKRPPKPKPQPKSKSAPKDTSPTAREHKNMYDALQQILSEDEDDDDQPPPAPKPAPASKNPVSKVVYQLDTKGDTLVAIYCLLQDFLELRFTVRSTWHLFVKDNGPCADLMTSAATTQCANDIVHVLAQDFVLTSHRWQTF